MALTPIKVGLERRRAARGPVTPEGKAISRANALDHGLSGSGLVLPEALRARVAAERSRLEHSLKPANPTEALLVEQMAGALVKAEEARSLQAEARAAAADSARAAWDAHRRIAALEVAARFDEQPEMTLSLLLTTLHGAEWIVSRWFGLMNRAANGFLWNESDVRLALDLLGFPRDFRDGVLPTVKDLGSEDALREHQRGLAETEMGNVRARINTRLLTLEERERERAERGYESIENRESRLFRRYERDALRRFEWAWGELRKLRQGKLDLTPAQLAAAPRTVEPPAPIRVDIPREALDEAEDLIEDAYEDLLDAIETRREEIEVENAPEARTAETIEVEPREASVSGSDSPTAETPATPGASALDATRADASRAAPALGEHPGT